MLRKTNWFNLDYLRWLCSLIGIDEKNCPKMFTLCRDLYETDFIWSVPNDDNRSEEGILLRDVYKSEKPDADISLDGNSSVLEMLIALSNEMDGITQDLDAQGKISLWFNKLILNLGLIAYDESTEKPSESIKIRYYNWRILETFLYRRYSMDGKGGLFPLKHPKEDQRNVEIWYQMMAYLNENPS